MVNADDLRYTRIALNNGSGAMPALGFGTLIPDPLATRNATGAALEAGFRVIDTAERYRPASQQDAGASLARLGYPARHGPTYYLEDAHPHPGEFSGFHPS